MIQPMRPVCPRLALLTTCLLILWAGCRQEIDFEGEPGQATTMKLRAWVPVLDIQVGDDPSKKPVIVDTGSPIMTFSLSAYPGLSLGANELDFTVFGLRFLDFTGYALKDLFGGKPVCGGTPVGLVGGDLLGHFRLGLDYRGKRAFLFYGDDNDPPVASGTDAPMAVPVQVLGGGAGELIKQGSGIFVELGPTRVVVAEALVEGKKVNVMVDTGASYTVVEGAFLTSLGATDRPTLCCETVGVVDGVVRMPMARLKSLSLGSVTVSNQPVLVVDQASAKQSLFANLSAEVGMKIQMLVGGSFLRHFAVNMDYEDASLSLARYKDQDHVSQKEFVGPGFAFCDSAQTGDFVVVNVYDNTDAKAQGVAPGSVLTAVDGTPVKGKTQQQVLELMRKVPVGSKTRLTFGSVEHQVKVERLLEDYK